MSITKRIEKMEKEVGKKNIVYIWVNQDETQEEALERSGRKIEGNDEVYYIGWEK